MPEGSQDLDLILKTRLDVLSQAIDEVKAVIKAMEQQRASLTEVEQFLYNQGVLERAEENLLEHIGDAANRLDLLRGTARPNTAVAWLPEAEPARPEQPEDDRQRRLREASEHAKHAEREIGALETKRREVYSSFQDVRRWSVAGLEDAPLQEAVGDYQHLINEIRKAENPWRRYQTEMPHRGHDLFSRYLDLLASMAVRGFGLDTTVASAVERLKKMLLKGVEATHDTSSWRSPLALMSSLVRGHMPLGYPEWSLWALPLMGRSAGELVVASRLPSDVDRQLRVVCADLYAQYVLGPSYLHAAIFLEFDPSPAASMPDAPPDSLRAALLLQKLRECGGDDEAHRKLVEGIAAPVDREWRRALEAVGCTEAVLDSRGSDVVSGFLEELAKDLPEIAYSVDEMADLADAGRELTADRDPEASEASVPGMQLRDLMSAMWLARLTDPSKARIIHTRAKAIASQGQRATSTLSVVRTQSRGATWT